MKDSEVIIRKGVTRYRRRLSLAMVAEQYGGGVTRARIWQIEQDEKPTQAVAAEYHRAIRACITIATMAAKVVEDALYE